MTLFISEAAAVHVESIWLVRRGVFKFRGIGEERLFEVVRRRDLVLVTGGLVWSGAE